MNYQPQGNFYDKKNSFIVNLQFRDFAANQYPGKMIPKKNEEVTVTSEYKPPPI